MNIRPRWRKVIHDLFDNKARTLLVVFSIAVGVFSIGVIAGAYQIIANDMSASYAANFPSNIELRMADFDETTLESVRNHSGIDEAEGRRVFSIRARVQGTTRWTVLELVAFDDFEGNQVNLLVPIEGKVVPGKREVVFERDAMDRVKSQVGDVLEFQLPDGSIKSMPLVGVVKDVAMGAGDFLASPYAFINQSTLQFLQESQDYNRVYATVTERGDDIEYVRALGAELKTDLENGGAYIIRSRFSETHLHPLATTVNAILGILMALGILIVFLSSSLIANTLAALLQQHMRHIGVIKLVGGNDRQVLVMYLALIMSFAALALAISVPLGGQGAYGLAAYIASELNFSLLGYRIVPSALLIQVLVGILVPLISGLSPVIGGSRVTVLSAISGEAGRESGTGHKGSKSRGVSRWEWLQTRFTILLARRGIHIPRPFVISLRNTFRRRGRLILTLFTLTMGGAIFIAVFNVRVTLHDYIDAISRYFVADVSVDFERPYRLREMEQVMMQVEGVERIEGWQFVSGELLDMDGRALENLNIFAPPGDSELIEPILVAGRWIERGDVRQFTISESVYKYYPDLEPGDLVKLDILGKQETWEVVGIFKFVDREGLLGYAPYEYISQATNLANRAFVYRVVTDGHTRSYQDAKAEELDAFLRDRGYKVHSAEAGGASLDVAVESLDVLVVFLLIMAVLTAVVGSMGLTGTMGMNVLERTREIGITRAIGADDRAVMRTVIAEGVVIGMLSFALAIVLSIPFTYMLSTIVSLAVFETPIATHFTWMGYVIWLGLVLVLVSGRFHYPRAQRGNDDDPGSAGVRITEDPKERYAMKKSTILFFVFAFALAACGTSATATPEAAAIPAPANAVIAEGHLVPVRDATLSFQARGTVREVRVEIGEEVKAGDVLARLGGQSDAAFAAAQLELVRAQQSLDTLRESSDTMRAKAWIALRDAETLYEDALDLYDAMVSGDYEYDRIVYTTIRGMRVPTMETVTVGEVDEETLADAKADMELKKALYDDAQRAYDRLKNGPDEDQLALLEASLEAAKANVAAFAVIAPFDGTVMDVNVVVGEQVGPELWAVKVADTSAWYVETSDLTELEVVRIKVGQAVSILPDALSEVEMTGVVETISQAFTMQGGDILYKVKIRLVEIDPRVLWGMTVEVTFEALE